MADLRSTLAHLPPRDAADRVLEVREGDLQWLDAFAERLDQRRAGHSLQRVFEVWGLSQAEASRLFGVSRQAVSKWLATGVPPERTETVADLAAVTDILVHYLKRDRIPAVVRRPIAARGGSAMLDLVRTGETRELLELTRAMFAFGEIDSA